MYFQRFSTKRCIFQSQCIFAGYLLYTFYYQFFIYNMYTLRAIYRVASVAFSSFSLATPIMARSSWSNFDLSSNPRPS